MFGWNKYCFNFQVVSIGTNSGRQRFRLFRRPISRRRAGPMHRGRRRGPSGGNTTNRKGRVALSNFVGDLKYGDEIRAAYGKDRLCDAGD